MIEINDLLFKVCHGLYNLEEFVPQEFKLDLRLEIQSDLEYPIKLSQTADYVDVYQLVQQIMHQQEGLIENLALKVNKSILENFPHIQSCVCRITKWPVLGGPGFVRFEAKDERA
ncbi:MAG: dihydroneopterin aldolase [Saprospiraceae bacterium]|nr:dihydroneopterin aldolase [Saprospiraceae bacterium]MBK9629767.1 dihydroneopterin aldolase [Saprospiraceae bacterium]